MGISGCEAAKDAADIIILDDNFKSVFKATQYGRNIYDNVRKFIQFQLTVNIACCTMVFLGGATLGESPFNVIQLLWINMIMDTLAAIALATEPPHPTELRKKRVTKGEKIIMKSMWRTILGGALYQILVMSTLLYFGPKIFNIEYHLIDAKYYYEQGDDIPAGHQVGDPTYRTLHYSLMFATFMLMQIFNAFNSRKLGIKQYNIFERFFNNFKFIFVLLIEFGVSAFMLESNIEIFRLTSLPWFMLVTAASFGVGTILV